ncbi:carboxypeptidase Q [Agrilus planipennis]|uniref:Carboxypeptidase Q n=1 Tax=Agrilus planipennis TaxID=224129 RepID=A0A1W4WA03_AGRPL|nr:carboxypeptidase Q [Agrilus planipennis]
MNLLQNISVTLMLLFSYLSSLNSTIFNNEVNQCTIPPELQKEIASYKTVVNRIIHSLLVGDLQNTTYRRLAEFIDKFGNRIAGSENLENAIDYMLNKSVELGLENVHSEEVYVPHWVRGNESAVLIQPRYQNLNMLGLGSSVGTPVDGITAEAVVVDSFEELENIAAHVYGKIVIFNERYISYGETVKYRQFAASKAAEQGAVATLVRSITPFSLNTPHTGWQDYSDNVTKIPTACITAEDSHMLRRMQDRGERIIIKLKMEAQTFSPKLSRNTIAEIKGGEKPEKVVVVSGHLDSWDVGEGAMDDGGGAFLSWNSLVILKYLGLRPKRTLRAILWTAEEEGLVGAQAYVKAHKNETQNFNFVMESDEGTFTPLGLKYTGIPDGKCVLEAILSLLKDINTTTVEEPADGGPDITFWLSEGIPGASLLNRAESYFWYHHSAADTMDVEDPEALNLATALWASVAYVVADITADMPRKPGQFL